MSKEDLIGGSPATPPENKTPANTEEGSGINIEYPENFPEEFHGNPTILKFADKETGKINYGNALSSLIHAQKLVGADKIMLPSKTATEDDWKNVFHKLGNPQNIEEYKVNVDGFNVEDPLSKGFIEAAHGAGILPSQAEKIVSYFNEANSKIAENVEADADADYQVEMNKLKEEWGKDYDSNIKIAGNAFSEIFTQEEQAYYKEKGALSDPVFVRAMGRVGKTILDDDMSPLDGESDRTTQAESLKASYHESYAIVAKGDKTNPSFEHHRRNLHKVMEKAGSLGISLV